MKRALLIVAAVAGYSLLEAGLLLSVIAPREYVSSVVRRAVLVGWGQFLLIPAMVVLFSRIIYGPRKLGRRALIALLIGPLVFYLFLGPFVALALILDRTLDVSRILLGIVTAVLFVAVAAAVRWCIRRSRQWNTEAEAERWLAERRSHPSERKWRSRGICFALCIPFTIVLLIFLFMPETWGLVSHIAYPHPGDLPGYRVKIPVTWIVQQRSDSSDGRSWVMGFFGRGIGSGFNPSRYDALSSWRFATSSFSGEEASVYDRWTPEEKDIIHDVAIGGEHIQCGYYRDRRTVDGQSTSAMANVFCRGATRFRASFYGPKTLLPDFYRVLGEIKSR